MGRLGLTVVFLLLLLLCLPFVLTDTHSVPVRILAGWAAVSMLMLSVAYALPNSDLLTKRPNGRLAIRSWVLFGPYLLLSLLLLHLHRVLSREPSFHEIADGLFLGRRPSRRDSQRLRAAGVVGILDLTAEFSELMEMRSFPGYLCIPLLDMSAPSPAELAHGCEHIREQREHGGVLVHCASGHGRSATFVVAHLVKSGSHASIAEAVAHVKSRRPGVGLTRMQRRLLEEGETPLRV